MTPKSAAQSRTSGSIASGMSRRSQISGSQAPRVDVVEQRARGVGGVGDVRPRRRSASRSGSCRRCRRGARRARARSRAPSWRVEQPLELGAGEVGVEQQPGPLGDHRLVAGGAQLGAERRWCGGPARRWRGRAAGRSSRSQTSVVSRWLVMPMAAMSAARDPGPLDRAAAGGGDASTRCRPGRARPSPSCGKCCGNSSCALADDADALVEDDGPARGRALVDGEDVAHRSFPFPALARRLAQGGRRPAPLSSAAARGRQCPRRRGARIGLAGSADDEDRGLGALHHPRAWLPRRNRSRPWRPCEVSTIRSQDRAFAASRMALAGALFSTWSVSHADLRGGRGRFRAREDRLGELPAGCRRSSRSPAGRRTAPPPIPRSYAGKGSLTVMHGDLGARGLGEIEARLDALAGKLRSVGRDQDVPVHGNPPSCFLVREHVCGGAARMQGRGSAQLRS